MIATGNQSIFSKNIEQKDQTQNLTTFLQVLIRDQKVQFINCRLPPQGVITVFISVSVSAVVSLRLALVSPPYKLRSQVVNTANNDHLLNLSPTVVPLTFIDNTTCSKPVLFRLLFMESYR